MDASNMLKPALARGELHCVGATTLDEYRKHVEKDAALARRFQPVFVSEPSVEDTISILRGLKEKYELHHGVRITDGAIVAAATLSKRYITDRFLPDKAIDLVDEAASRLRMAVDSKPEQIDELDRRIVQLKIEREALKKETDQGSRDRLQRLEGELRSLESQSADLTRQIIQMPAGSIAAAAFPIAVNSLVQHGSSKAREQLERFGAVLLAVTVPAAVGLALTIPYLASFLLGPAFRATAGLIVPMLAVGWLFQSITQYYVHVSFHLAKKPEWSLLQGLASVIVNIATIWPMTEAWGLQGTAASFMISEAFGVVIGLMLTRFAYPLPYLFGPLARTCLASGLMAGTVLVLKQFLPVPGALTFTVLAASGMLVYGLAAIALNICDARGVLRVLGLRLFAVARG